MSDGQTPVVRPPTDQELLASFRMPNGLTITSRASSIRNVFVAAIVPKATPKPEEIAEVLRILQLDPRNLECAYCGGSATEWEHLQPLVKDGRPTGYPSSIRNLVPSCGRCNQSKGSKPWRTWILSSARLSPTTRGVADLAERIARLEAYEAWADCKPLDIPSLVDGDLLEQYFEVQEKILQLLREGQVLSKEIAQQIMTRGMGKREM